ncbi:Uncharacterized protein conserved in bacteria [Cedecea davisae]|uniref:TssC1 C-terminal domain-containing protein n=1 Tax=Cedecea davisae DSM 4568 TaxID=566551 RepID=S3J0S8_9ENTR|nr:type VI secretion system contractile sheath large subunit [Cedecea davisae]EPF18770.1 hypothetical protein HMPREF0201_01376 [Cedecea davisae DSM 4568]SUX28351.1 Uncharacterized protein conserved in bacteria [Cedecea davisae]
MSNSSYQTEIPRARINLKLDLHAGSPGFFRVNLYAIPHFQVEGMDVNLPLVSLRPKTKS